MAKNKKRSLQEIYGDDADDYTLQPDDDVEVTSEEVGNALTEIISELKAKYGAEWTKHIGEVSE
tara:strand:+ start:300 stop:491 length:192 start_codon:yes stop_codon:yes gene_type:complete